MKFLIVFGCIALAVAVPIKSDEPATVLKSFTRTESDGSYEFGFDSSDGIEREQSGKVLNAGRSDQTIEVETKYRYIDPNGNPVEGEQYIEDGKIVGRYIYTDPNGDKVDVDYTATKAGFVPFGTNIAKEISEAAANATPFDEYEFKSAKPAKPSAPVTPPKKRN